MTKKELKKEIKRQRRYAKYLADKLEGLSWAHHDYDNWIKIMDIPSIAKRLGFKVKK